MRVHARVVLLALVTSAIVAVSAPAAQAAFGVTKFEALTCKSNAPEGKPGECSAATPELFFTQAAGHPNVGVTDFTFNELGTKGNGVKSIRTDLPVGFSTNPQALPQCNLVDFNANLGKAEANHCNSNTEAGTQEITIVLPGPTLVTLTGIVYNLNPAPGLPLEFGIDIALPFLGGIHVHSLLEGAVSWHKEAEATEMGIESGDYHEFFKIKIHKSLTEGEAPIDMAAVEKVLREAELPTLIERRQQIMELEAALKQIRTVWIDKCSSGPAVALDRLPALCDVCRSVLSVRGSSPTRPAASSGSGDPVSTGGCS